MNINNMNDCLMKYRADQNTYPEEITDVDAAEDKQISERQREI